MTSPEIERAVFVYDGHCVLCSGFARHVADRDASGEIRLVASQSDEGRALYRRLGLEADAPTTNLFVDRGGHVLTHSDSSLAVLEAIGYPATLLRIAAMVPTPARDALYRFVAQHRYRVFGRHATCRRVDRHDPVSGGTLRRAMGTDYDRLPPAIRQLHAAATARGEADVVHGAGLLAWLVCRVLSLPAAGRAVPLAVTFERRGAEERWTRSFGGRITRSRLRPSLRPGHLLETFGPVRVETHARADSDGLLLQPVRAWLFGVPLPRSFTPGGRGRESALQDHFGFDVEIEIFGRRIVAYRGHLDEYGGLPDAERTAT